MGAEAADGPDECIRAVRKQIGAGADWIKVCSNFIIRKAISYFFMQIYAGEMLPLLPLSTEV